MTVIDDITASLEPNGSTADRATAYATLLARVAADVEPEALGRSVEKWATFMAGTDVSKAALIAGLVPIRERCPLVSLSRVCQILDLDIGDLVADQSDGVVQPAMPAGSVAKAKRLWPNGIEALVIVKQKVGRADGIPFYQIHAKFPGVWDEVVATDLTEKVVLGMAHALDSVYGCGVYDEYGQVL